MKEKFDCCQRRRSCLHSHSETSIVHDQIACTFCETPCRLARGLLCVLLSSWSMNVSSLFQSLQLFEVLRCASCCACCWLQSLPEVPLKQQARNVKNHVSDPLRFDLIE